MRLYEQSLRPMYGTVCWDVTYHPMLNLSFQLGQPGLKIDGETEFKGPEDLGPCELRKRRIRIEGQWFVWIYHAYWTIRAKGRTVASTSAPDRLKRMAARFLEGQRLTEIQIKPGTGQTAFAFDLGASLTVRRIRRSSKDELWSVNKPNGYVLCIRGDGTFDHEPSSGTDGRPRIVRRPLPMLVD